MIRISVVVPFYNSERYISDCVEGLFSQSYPMQHYEIVMVDNNSTDASAEIVKRYPSIKLVHEEKQGAYAARNRGVNETRGEIIAFTDPDCVPSSDWLQKIEAAMAHSGVGIAIGSHQLARGSFFLSMLADYENERDNYVFNSNIKELYYSYNNNMAVLKKLFDEIGPFVERPRGSDSIFVRQCVERYSCEVVRYCPEIRVRHMEINSLNKLFRKYFIYGDSSRKYRYIAHIRPLTNWERFLIFLRTIRSHRYSWIKSTFLFSLLAIGLVYWVMGSISTSWNFKRKVAM